MSKDIQKGFCMQPKEKRRTKEKDPEGGPETRTHGNACLLTSPPPPDLISMPQRFPLSPPPPISNFCRFPETVEDLRDSLQMEVLNSKTDIVQL
jgi:hypothetical protein